MTPTTPNGEAEMARPTVITVVKLSFEVAMIVGPHCSLARWRRRFDNPKARDAPMHGLG